MKKTVKINLNSLAFHIDEDAYILLDDYLSSVKVYFDRYQDSGNIIEDIEARIAELFQTKISNTKQVINNDDVQEVINTLGKPSDFGAEEDTQEKDSNESYIFKKSKRLYRDKENGLLGGVSAGLGEYLNLDPLWIRIAFILLLFASLFGLVLYIILWIVVPPARTTAEKLEMRGESITLDNIEKTINTEYQKVKKNFDDWRSSGQYRNFSSTLTEIFNTIGKILLAIIKFAGLLVGVVLIIAGILALLGITGMIFFDFNALSNLFDMRFDSFREILERYTHSEDVTLLMLSIFLTAVLPLFALIYGGIKMIFQVKTNDKALGLGIFVLWLLSAIFAVYTLVIEKEDLDIKGYHGIEQTIQLEESDIMYIGTNQLFEKPEMFTRFLLSEKEYGLSTSENSKILYDRPEIRIRQSRDNKYRINIIKQSMGLNQKKAEMHARNIMYDYVWKDSVLTLDPYFIVDMNAKWRDPELILNLYVPVDKRIYIDDNAKDLFRALDTKTKREESIFTEKQWLMTECGLILAKK